MTKVSRAMKYVVLLAGALGVLAFFLPFFVFEVGSRRVEASAYTLLVGFDDPALEPLRHEAAPDCVQNVLQLDNGSILGGYVCGQADKHNSYVPYYFASAIVFSLLALWAIARRRMSGLAGVLALPASCLAIGGWLRELKLDRLSETSHTTVGASLLGLSGILALLATVVLLVRREPPRPAKKKPMEKPTLPEARVVR
jgi:hypothetical protein